MLNKVSSGVFDSLDIGLLYMQVVSLVFSFSVSFNDHTCTHARIYAHKRWACNTYAYRAAFYLSVQQFFSLINFDVDFFTPSVNLKSIMHAQAHTCRPHLSHILEATVTIFVERCDHLGGLQAPKLTFEPHF